MWCWFFCNVLLKAARLEALSVGQGQPKLQQAMGMGHRSYLSRQEQCVLMCIKLGLVGLSVLSK